MNLKKFNSGPKFLEPFLTEHNNVVDALTDTVQAVSGSDGVHISKISHSYSISLNRKIQKFRFGMARNSFFRGENAIIQLCEYNGREWQLVDDYRIADSDFITGFYFASTPLRLLEIPETKQLHIMSEGCWNCKAVADDDYNETFDDWVYATPANYPSEDGINRIQLYLELAETVVAGTTIYCNWDDGGLQWNGIAEKC